MAPKGKSEKSIFLENLSSDFRKFFSERTPRRDLPIDMTDDPLPPLGAELGGPKNWDQPKKSPTSGFRGSKFLPP